MPNNTNNLISLRFKNKTNPAPGPVSTAEIVVLDDRRPRHTWQRLDVVLARLGLLARSRDVMVELVLHPPKRRRPNR
jgi:hypothetical protein